MTFRKVSPAIKVPTSEEIYHQYVSAAKYIVLFDCISQHWKTLQSCSLKSVPLNAYGNAYTIRLFFPSSLFYTSRLTTAARPDHVPVELARVQNCLCGIVEEVQLRSEVGGWRGDAYESLRAGFLVGETC